MRSELKLQLEAFFSCVILGLDPQQEVAIEALVGFCKEKNVMVEMYINFDCDITCSNVFEYMLNLLLRSALPVNGVLSSKNLLALNGLNSVIQGMAERIKVGSLTPEIVPISLEEYILFWKMKCENYTDPGKWVSFVRQRKYIKRMLSVGAELFNRDPKKGLEYLQENHILPEKHDPLTLACFFRYTSGLDKKLVGDILGDNDEFPVKVRHEFAGLFDFKGTSFDIALRLYVESFLIPGEAQQIDRVFEAFSERYYNQCPETLADPNAACVLSYSLLMLCIDLHNPAVKNKMTEEIFIRYNRGINNGNDLPRELLSELYHSILKNELPLHRTPEQITRFQQKTPSGWVDLIKRSQKKPEFILSDSNVYIDRDMFAIMARPAIIAVSTVFDHTDDLEVYKTCVDSFLAMAKISSFYSLVDVLDELVASLCNFTTLLDQSFTEPVTAFADNEKAKIATETVFTIGNTYGDFISKGWEKIVTCTSKLHKLGLSSSNL